MRRSFWKLWQFLKTPRVRLVRSSSSAPPSSPSSSAPAPKAKASKKTTKRKASKKTTKRKASKKTTKRKASKKTTKRKASKRSSSSSSKPKASKWGPWKTLEPRRRYVRNKHDEHGERIDAVFAEQLGGSWTWSSDAGLPRAAASLADAKHAANHYAELH